MLVDERWDEMLALAQKINHWALGHYRAAMEDHNTREIEMIPTWKGGDNLSCCDKSSFKSQFINHIFRHTSQRAIGPMKAPFFTNIHGLLRGFFNQPKPATESLISTTYKWRDAPFPMAEEGCKLEGLGQDILHLDRRCSALLLLCSATLATTFLASYPTTFLSLGLSKSISLSDKVTPAPHISKRSFLILTASFVSSSWAATKRRLCPKAVTERFFPQITNILINGKFKV